MGYLLLIGITLLTTLYSCKRKIGLVESRGYIIGFNDIEVINDTNEGAIPAKILNAAVVLATRLDEVQQKFCSGTLIEPDTPNGNPRILTNHHCFIANQDRIAVEPLLASHCKATMVFFGFYQNAISERLVFRCKEGTFRSTIVGDLAVFELDKIPPEPFIPVSISKSDPIENQDSLMVHFPQIDHTAKNYESRTVYEPAAKVKIPYGQVTRTNCRFLGSFTNREVHIDPSLPYSLKHTCDQEQGSSGSALWDLEALTIAGINWGGITLKLPEKATNDTYNIATRPTAINAFLQGETFASNSTTADTESATSDLNQSGDLLVSKNHNSKGQEASGGCGSIKHLAIEQSLWLRIMLIVTPILLAFWGQRR